MKTLAVFIWLALIFIGISALFWYNDWKYKLPTPISADYKAVSTGTTIELPQQINSTEHKPVFLHFFNPDCPCSRFNIDHFRLLVKQYGQQMHFVIVVMNNTRYSAEQIQHKFGLDLPVSFDTTLAKACGVYSTPQAVILTITHQLYYRGNYNKSRYCTEEKTSYAKIALNALLKNSTPIAFDQYALRAYGCQLPQCTKSNYP